MRLLRWGARDATRATHPPSQPARAVGARAETHAVANCAGARESKETRRLKRAAETSDATRRCHSTQVQSQTFEVCSTAAHHTAARVIMRWLWAGALGVVGGVVEVPCATTPPASHARRFLVVATGHVRSLATSAASLHARVVRATPAPVDVVYVLWHDEGYGCEAAALSAAADLNFSVFYDPRACDRYHHPGFHNQDNQWRAVHRALNHALALTPGARCGVDAATGASTRVRVDSRTEFQKRVGRRRLRRDARARGRDLRWDSRHRDAGLRGKTARRT